MPQIENIISKNQSDLESRRNIRIGLLELSYVCRFDIRD